MIKGIICFETEWDVRSKNKLDTEPLLRFLETYYKGLDCIHRNIVTKDQLVFYFKKFGTKQFQDYAVFFCSHGETGTIKLEGEKNDVSLEELAELAGNFFSDKIVHFSSCRTLKGNSVLNFMEDSQAKAVSGYTKVVDMTKSAICDLTYYDTIIRMKQLLSAKKKLEVLDIAKDLGFRMEVR